MNFHTEVKKIAILVNQFDVLVKTAKKKWIPENLKSGRFEGWSLTKMKKRYSQLRNKEEKTKKEISEMRALALGIRFKGGDVPGGKKKKGL